MTVGAKKLPFGIDLSPLSIIRMLWKQRLLIGIAWVAVSALALVVVRHMPAVYSASALIILDSQKIPEKFVASTVSSDVQDRFAAISQQILSSSQLKKLIDQFDLYRKDRGRRLPEEILEMMRRDLSIAPEKAVTGNRLGAFRIAYQGPDPVIVAKVANQIASLYVEENIKNREGQAEGTSEFIEAQLNAAKEKLDQLEAEVSGYKVKHNGELPQQEGSLNSILTRFYGQLEANRDAINRAHQSKVMIESALTAAEQAVHAQIGAMEAIEASRNFAARPAIPMAAGQEFPRESLRSEVLLAELENLRLRYSDEHPEVQRLKIDIERMQEIERAQTPKKPVRINQTAGTQVVGAPLERPRIRDTAEIRQSRERVSSLQSQITFANQEIEARKNEQKRILAEIDGYQARIGRLPIREQEMAQITRDYEISKTNYKSLLDKKISAEMASEMERRQKAERFTIADTARVPGKPVRPNRPIFYAAGSVLGLFLGVAIGLMREVRQGSLLGEWQVPAGVAVLGRLPYIHHSSLSSPAAPDRAGSAS